MALPTLGRAWAISRHVCRPVAVGRWAGIFAVIVWALGTAAPVSIAGGSGAEETLAILPQDLVLTCRELPARLMVERMVEGTARGEVRTGLVWTSSDPGVATVAEGLVTAVGNGSTTITATAEQRTASLMVEVRGLESPFVWSFRNHALSVLTKAGCNSGACHGALAGKNGFKLSLRGYDPEGDFQFLTRQARGRRIVPGDPGRSLLLTKPSGAVPHRGGVRFAVDSPEYRVLAEWIAAGTPAPVAEDPRLARLEILPERAVLEPGAEQQLVVRAHFSDGRVEDVTRWAKFTAAQASVADVDDQGLVRVMGPGEGAVTAWYLSRVVNATVTVPYPQAIDAGVFAAAERRNLIDERVLAKLVELRLAPSPPADDATFIRRAYLDTLGVLPTPAETSAYLADGDPAQRQKLIDSLLVRPELVDYWAYRWSELLLINSERLPPPAMWSFYHWVRNHVAANTPWDQMVRELLTARGGTLDNGATNFYQLHADPLDLAETTTVAFLGMSINCARCHNHPLEKWTNDQYFGFANLFAQVRSKNGDRQQVVFDAEDGELVQPLRGVPQTPTPLDGAPLPSDSPATRREYLAAWVTSAENPYFARAVVNRVWANFLGRGLVESVDDMRLTNPPSNEALLADLADYLVEQQFDLRALIRLILSSGTYARSSATLPENAADDRFYSRYYPRRLMAEVLLDAISQATAVPSEFPGYPAGWRSLQLPDSNVNSYFLKTFGRPERVITCECERTAEPSMVQVLHLSNGDVLNQKLARPGNLLDRLVAESNEPAAWVEGIYRAALSRGPTDDERARLVELLAVPEPSQRRAALEDLLWSVVSSREFLFNH